ncbi:alpha/beta hydrolase [Saccharopolyspora sp. K220]|uniref:alpha/beta hydrolase n=1 Tax=Saccharopolyspora soli TaxID=2926618 RepID=UPI001F569200|nr:alpha/beta hydrolase [Saccharopolyspora soli]MCI2420596.1 alpha/beta hydrolase [Saccharopolyspora soli]
MKVKSASVAVAAALGIAVFATGCAAQPGQSTATPTYQPAAQGAPAPAKPTVVLVPGAFEDASAWNKVTRELQAEGFPVVAPAVPLRGVESDTAAVEGVVDAIRGPKILVGHSYGGLLVSALATKTTDVTALVYVAAFIPEVGETAGQLNAQFPGSLIGPATTHTISGPAGDDLYVNVESFRELFAAGAPAADAAVDAAGQRPILAAAFEEKVTGAAPANIRKYAIVATEDKAIPPAAERFQAQRAGAVITEVRSPHAVAATNPKAVVDVIEQAAG